MAKRRKRRAKRTVKKRFVILFSECDGASQLASVSDDKGAYAFATAADAKAGLERELASETFSGEGSYAIAEVVEIGKTSGQVTWNSDVNVGDW